MPFSGSPRRTLTVMLTGRTLEHLMHWVMFKQLKEIASSQLVLQTCPMLHYVIVQDMFMFTNSLKAELNMPVNKLSRCHLQIMKSLDSKPLMEEFLSWQNKACMLFLWIDTFLEFNLNLKPSHVWTFLITKFYSEVVIKLLKINNLIITVLACFLDKRLSTFACLGCYACLSLCFWNALVGSRVAVANWTNEQISSLAENLHVLDD